MNKNKLINIIQETIREVLTEDKKSTIINKVKLPDFVAEWAESISDKFAVWIANDFKKNMLRNSIGNDIIRNTAIKNMEELIKNSKPIDGGLKRIIVKEMSDKEGGYRNIIDWLLGRNQGPASENDKINLKTLTYRDALQRSEEWHDRLAQIQSESEPTQIIDEDGEVIKTYSDGFYWIDLGKKYCEKEGNAMGHCGRGEGILYSLRKKGMPYVTADILSDGTVRQMRGRANTKPKKDYHKYIIDFLGSEFVDNFNYWDYKIEDNFKLSDLEENQIKELIIKKPSLLESQDLSKLFDIETLKELIKVIDFNELSELSLINSFDDKTLKEMFESNPSKFKSLYLNVKFRDKSYLKSISPKFTDEGVELIFDDWSDEKIIDLFHRDYQVLVKEILNNDLNIDNYYILGEDIREIYLPKINEENLNIIKEKFKLKNLEINNNEELFDSITEEVEEILKNSYMYAKNQLDEDVYFQRVVDVLKNMFGNYNFNDDDLLVFKINYNDFLKFLKELSEIDSEINTIEDFKNASNPIMDIILYVMDESSYIHPLKIDIREVNSIVDKNDFNEVLSDNLSEL